MKGYFSTTESPLDIYLCRSGCPGGAPGVCEGGLVGLTCGECPENFYKSSGDARLTTSSLLETNTRSAAPVDPRPLHSSSGLRGGLCHWGATWPILIAQPGH